MVFAAIRLIFIVIAFVICLWILTKSHIIHKRKWSLIVLAGAAILTTIFTMVPIENAFVTFPSPESAYKYTNYGDSDNVKLVIPGKESAFVVGGKNQENVYQIIPQANNGWKLGLGLNTKRIAQIIDDGIIIYVYQYRGLSDYYITLLDTKGGQSEIADSCNSIFSSLSSTNPTLKETFYTYYAYINCYNEQYSLTVNGKVMDFNANP